MLFNSIEFICFFIVVVALYYALPQRIRWLLLLTASYYFYMSWKAEYVILIMISTLICYLSAIKMSKHTEKHRKRKYLVLAVCSNLAVLLFYKYFNFFGDSITALLQSISISFDMPYLELLLPVGISFYTFQALSYTVDVYRGNREPERHLGIFALYVSFFPQLVAGPIERSTTLLPQFHEEKRFDYQNMVSGLQLIAWGFFKKLVVADRLALYVDRVYANPESFGGITLIVATVLFSFQIYCDFSGYSDIARGTARTMGYNLMENFRRPYFAASIKEFWSRWHISLSTWFRDYLYIPLGGNRVSPIRMHANVLAVFLLSGLWHGASWTFVVWGALHGIYSMLAVVIMPFTARLRSTVAIPALWRIFKIVITYFLVLIAWVFFRADSVKSAVYILSEMSTLSGTLFFQGDYQIHLLYSILAIVILLSVEIRQEYSECRLGMHEACRQWMREVSYAALIASILLFGVFDGGQFIYFQF